MMPTFVYAYLNARISPQKRVEWLEGPLAEAVAENSLGEVTGGGTEQSAEGEVEFCGIDLELSEVDAGILFVGEFLTKRGAPLGSKLQYEMKGKKIEVPFGKAEGLAIYLNTSDLPQQVYDEHDVTEVLQEIDRSLGRRGNIMGHWSGPNELALYLYGHSADEMRQLTADLLASHPLCQKSRVVQIA